MKILHIITGLGNGGAEKTLFRLVSSEKEHVHLIVTLTDLGVYGERLKKLGLTVEVLNMTRRKVSFRSLVSLFQFIKKTNPDVIQTWMYHPDLIGGLIGRLAGVKRIYWGIRGPYNKARTPLSTKVVVKICSWFSNSVPTAIVSNSQHAIEAHIAVGYKASRFTRIPNGYDMQAVESCYSTVEARAMLNLDINKILFGMVARFDPYKDHETLLIAFGELIKIVQNIGLVLVGSGMDHQNEKLIRLIQHYDLTESVYLLGPREDVPNIMVSLDIHVLSSAAESFPNVLAEAMAVGTPCVSTDVGDAAKIIGETGWIVPPSSPYELRDGMLTALNAMQNDNDWDEVKNSCRERVAREFSQKKMVNSFVELWSDNICV